MCAALRYWPKDLAPHAGEVFDPPVARLSV